MCALRFAHRSERLVVRSLLASGGLLHSITKLHIGILALHFPIDLHDLLVPGTGTLRDATLLVCVLARLAAVLTMSLASMLCHLF